MAKRPISGKTPVTPQLPCEHYIMKPSQPGCGNPHYAKPLLQISSAREPLLGNNAGGTKQFLKARAVMCSRRLFSFLACRILW